MPTRKYDEAEEKVKNRWKKESSSATISTLSLHIAAYEKSVESFTNAFDKNEGFKKKGLIEKWKNVKQIFTESLQPLIQNLFELPRQQKEGQVDDPEVMQFKASQRLLNPNQSTSSTSFPQSSPEFSFNMNYSDPVQSPKNTVLERLKISLAVLITNSEFIPIINVVQRHNRYFEPSIEYIMIQRGFHNYVQLFECFPNSFKLSDDQQSVTFLRTAPPQPVLPYTHLIGYVTNIRKRAWYNIIKVRELVTNHAIHEPLRVNDFNDVIVPDRILLNLRRMNIFHLTNIQQYILPYLFNGKNDLLIEGTKFIGRTIGVLTSLLSQIHMFKHVQKARRGPLAVILLQSSPYPNAVTPVDTSQSTIFADHFCKTLFLLSEHLNITTGFDSIDITKDICVITFKDIREHEERTLQYLQFFIAFNVEQIISKVGHNIFCARTGAFAPKDAATIFVMEDYQDPGPVMLRDCFKKDAIFISDKT